MNIKALVATAVVVAALAGGGLLASGVFRDRVRGELLAQSDALIAAGAPDKTLMAMRHLERFLDRNPDDVEVLDRFTRLLTESALAEVAATGQSGRLDAAIAGNERLLRLDPEGAVAEDPQQNRRWLARLFIIKTDLIRRVYGGLFEEADQYAASEDRSQAAAQVARELIRRGGDDAEAHRLLAMALEGAAGRTGSVEDAIASYATALDRDPADLQSAERLARLYRDRERRPGEADRVLDALLAAAPESADAALVAYRHHTGSDAERAAAALARAVGLAPDDGPVVLAAAGEALGRGDRQAARALLDGLPEGIRNAPEVEVLRATIDLQERQTDEAIGRMREALGQAGGADPRLVWTLANTLIDSGKLAEARPLIERFGKQAGADQRPSYLVLAGLFHQKAGQPDEAIRLFDESERNLADPLKPQMLVARGRCKLTLGDRAAAIRDLRAAVDLAPELPLARLSLAETLAAEGIDRAVAELRQGITAAPGSLELRQALLKVLLLIQEATPANRRNWAQFDEAIRDARATRSIGDDPALAAPEARRLHLDDRAGAAFALLERATGRRPDEVALWSTWKELLERDGRRDEALAVLERASGPEAAGDNAAFRLSRAQLLAQLGRGREAIDVLLEGAPALPSDQRGPLYQALGQLYAARGQFAEARSAYVAWKRAQPGSAGPPLALLGLAVDIGDRPTADEALDELLAGVDPGLRRKVAAAADVRRLADEFPGGQFPRNLPLPYLLGRAEYELRLPGGDRVEPIELALFLLEPILGGEDTTGEAPELAPARLLRGLALMQRGEAGGGPGDFRAALEDLRAAWDGGERRSAEPMIDLLVRLDRFDELDALIATQGINVDLTRMAAEASLRHNVGNRASDYVERAGVLAGDSPQFAAWRLGMLDRLGETANVEQALRSQAEGRRDAASWIALIRYQAARGRRDEAEGSIAEMKRVVEAGPPALLEAQAREAIGDLAAAEAAYEAAVEDPAADATTLLAASRFDQLTGRPDRAIERAERALAADPDSRPAARFRALLLAELAGDAAAWRSAWEALGPEPDRGDAEGPQDRLARALVLARHPDPARREEAVGRLELLIGDQPSGDLFAAAARETLARLLLQQGRADRAAEIAAVTALNGTNPAAVALYCQALIAAGQVDEATRQLDRLRNLATDAAVLTELELRLVEARAEAGSIAEELEATYQAAVSGNVEDDADPSDTAVAIFRRLAQLGDPGAEVTGRVGRDLARRFPTLAWIPAQWYVARDAYPEALELAGPAIDSGDPEAAFEGARAALTVVDRSDVDPAHLDRATALIERAAAADGAAPATRAIRAMLHHFQGLSDPAHFDDEIRLYRELLQAEPENAIYLNNLAWALGENAGRPDEALRLIDRALEAPGSRVPELLDTRAVVLHRLDRHDEAIETLDEVVRERPNSPVYRFHLARALEAVGRADEAREAIARALELGLTPEDVEPSEREEFDRLKAL